MNLSVTRLMMVSAFAAALHFGASTANAETAKFTLPFEAHWGSTVLPAGSYTLSTVYTPSNIRIFYLHSEAGNQFAAAPIVDTKDTNDSRSCLKLVNIGGSYYVREYVSSISGTAMEFAVPKADRHELKAERQRVVEVTGS